MGVDFVLPPAEIARRVANIGDHLYMVPERTPPGDLAESDETVKQILSMVRSGTGVDFSQYRETAIRRRINRRLALHAPISRDVTPRRSTGKWAGLFPAGLSTGCGLSRSEAEVARTGRQQSDMKELVLEPYSGYGQE